MRKKKMLRQARKKRGRSKSARDAKAGEKQEKGWGEEGRRRNDNVKRLRDRE